MLERLQELASAASSSVRVHGSAGSGYSLACQILGLPVSGDDRNVLPAPPVQGETVVIMRMWLDTEGKAAADARFGDGAADALISRSVGEGWLLQG